MRLSGSLFKAVLHVEAVARTGDETSAGCGLGNKLSLDATGSAEGELRPGRPRVCERRTCFPSCVDAGRESSAVKSFVLSAGNTGTSMGRLGWTPLPEYYSPC